MAVRASREAVPLTMKRKHADQYSPEIYKKPRHSDAAPQPTSLSLQPLAGFLTDLQPKYDVKTLSVLSSTSIARRVDSVLTHLDRFDLWDSAVLPGVVLLYARADAANKLITIAETVRRRIHEGGQKWYQYNRLYEMEWPSKQSASRSQAPSVVEATVLGDAEGEDDSYFETMGAEEAPPTQFERAVHGEPKVRQVAHLSILLSRVPVPELRARDNFTVQSNEEHIDLHRKKRDGLV